MTIKKILVMLFASFVITGCGSSTPPEGQQMSIPNTPKQDVSVLPCSIATIPSGWWCYTQSEFSVLLPSDYSGIGVGEAGSFISSDSKKFIYSSNFRFDSKPLLQQGKLKEFVELGIKNLCSETEGCPKLISAEYVTLGENRFLKYEEEHQGGTIDKPGEPYTTFHYATLLNDQWVDFSTPDKETIILPPYADGVSIISEGVDEVLFERIVTTLM